MRDLIQYNAFFRILLSKLPNIIADTVSDDSLCIYCCFCPSTLAMWTWPLGPLASTGATVGPFWAGFPTNWCEASMRACRDHPLPMSSLSSSLASPRGMPFWRYRGVDGDRRGCCPLLAGTTLYLQKQMKEAADSIAKAFLNGFLVDPSLGP